MAVTLSPSLAAGLGAAPVKKDDLRAWFSAILAAINSDLDPRATPIYASRAAAVSAAADLPAGLTHIAVREGTALVIRSRTAAAVTLNVGGAGAWPVQRRDGTPVQAGDLKAGVSYLLRRRSNSWRLIGLLDSEVQARGDAVISDAGVISLTGVAGPANAITAAKDSRTDVLLSATSIISLAPVADNTGPVTLNVGSAGAWPVQRGDGRALQPGDLKAGVVRFYRRSGSAWRMIGAAASEALGPAKDVVGNAGIIHLTSLAGSANAITAAKHPNTDVLLSATSIIGLQPVANNTGAVTLNIGGAGNWPLQRGDGSELQAGDLRAGATRLYYRSGNAWRMIGAAPGEVLTPIKDVISDAGIIKLVNLGGTGNAITAAKDPKTSVLLSATSVISLTPIASNTGAVTLNTDGAGNWPVQRGDGSAVQPGDLKAGVPRLYRRSGDAWRMIGAANSDVREIAGAAAGNSTGYEAAIADVRAKVAKVERKTAAAVVGVAQHVAAMPERPDAEFVVWHTWDDPADSKRPYDQWVQRERPIVGGVPIGSAGEAGSIYDGFVLAAVEDFNDLDLLTVNNPSGKYIPSHRRRGRRAINSGANDYYWSPDHTGFADANRGIAIGPEVDDLISVAGGVLSLSSRLATAREKALAWRTTASTGPERPQSSSALHSAGYQAVKWPCVIEARMRVPTGADLPAGAWPAFWTENVLPTWANTGEWDFEWRDDGRLGLNFITGTSVDDNIATAGLSDGEWHVFSLVATAAQLRFFRDGALIGTATKRPDAHVPGPMFWWFRIGVDLTPKIYIGGPYDAADWVGKRATMDVDYVRLWTLPTATNLGYRGIVASLDVSFDEAFSVALPSKTELWGAENITEYLIWQPIEGAEPGISELPQTAAPNRWYGHAAMQNGQWRLSFLSWSASTRRLAGASFDQAGRMIGHLVAWDDINGGVAGFARVVFNVGPRVTIPRLVVAADEAVSVDLYAACDCGMLTTNRRGRRAKTIVVTGLPAGLTYDDATGLLSGTATAGDYPVTITCTNSIGQSVSQTIPLTVSNRDYELWSGPGWFDASDASTITLTDGFVSELQNKWLVGDRLISGTGSGLVVTNAAQNGLPAITVSRDTANPPRLNSVATSELSRMFHGEDRPYTVLVVFKPLEAGDSYIWSMSRYAASSQQIALLSRANGAQSRQKSGSPTNDVGWGSGHPANMPRIVAIKSTGQAVSVWDTSTTKSVDAAPQNASAFNGDGIFRLFASAADGAPLASLSKALQFFEIVIEAGARSDAEVQHAISDLATKWGIPLS